MTSQTHPVFLSYILDEHTPSYGNRERFVRSLSADMCKGDAANSSSIATTVHMGTHIDLPLHFHERGQDISTYTPDFWVFQRPYIVEVAPQAHVIGTEIGESLADVPKECDFLILKTGASAWRNEERYWRENYGFHPDVADALRATLPKLRVFGFDSISLTSFTDRMLGREAHRRFLDPSRPILPLEDMDLCSIGGKTLLSRAIIAPLRIANCDGLPCTILAWVND